MARTVVCEGAKAPYTIASSFSLGVLVGIFFLALRGFFVSPLVVEVQHAPGKNIRNTYPPQYQNGKIRAAAPTAAEQSVCRESAEAIVPPKRTTPVGRAESRRGQPLKSQNL